MSLVRFGTVALLAVVLVVPGASIGSAGSQGHMTAPLRWVKLGIPALPLAALGDFKIAYDPGQHGVLLLYTDRLDANSYTWLLRHQVWTNLTVNRSTEPTPRGGEGMVYDASDGYVVLFGGAGSWAGSCASGTSAGICNDTWKFTHGIWQRVLAPHSPPPLYRFGMTYDARDGYVLLFGGAKGVGPGISNQTWAYHHGNWTRMALGRTPPPLYDPALAFDGQDAKVVLFGGARAALGDRNETWTYQGGQWTRLPPGAPLARDFADIVYSHSATGLIVTGGESGPTQDRDTWRFAQGTWTNLTAAVGRAPASQTYMMTWDGALGQTVLVGYGFSVWVLG